MPDRNAFACSAIGGGDCATPGDAASSVDGDGKAAGDGGVGDGEASDIGVSDIGVSDIGVSDIGVSDVGVSDIGVSDAGVGGSGPGDGGASSDSGDSESNDAPTVGCGAKGDCVDGNPCTTDSCAADGSCVFKLIDCSDANPCTTDICNGLNGECLHPGQAGACDDGDPCTDGDSCAQGSCVQGAPRDCDDGKVCTADSCALGVCGHVAVAAPCSDGNNCTKDVCQGGECVGVPGDNDGDGFGNALCGGKDCNDKAKSVHPGAPEQCNGLDDDCDGATDEDLVWKGIALGQPCSVGVGACAASGTVLCAASVAACNAKAGGQGSWSSSPAGNGSWDWDCDGVVAKRYKFTTTKLAEPLGWCNLKSDPSWNCHATSRGSNGDCLSEYIANCGGGDACGVSLLKAECTPTGSYNCNAAGVVGLIKQECR